MPTGLARKILLTLGVCVWALTALTTAQARDGSRNSLFYYPHMQASPYTMSAGQVVIGTSAVVGVTDFMEIGTDLVRDFYKIFNAHAKVSLVDYPLYAVGLSLGYETYNLNAISDANPDFRVSTWSPAIHLAYALAKDIAFFGGFRFNLSNNIPSDITYTKSGYQRGAELGADLSWAYNGHGSNALAAGMTYDFTTSIYGIGFSHHWPTFQLGIHYYPNADVYKVQPIIAGGMALDL
jgi:hypothetical protein